MRITLKIAQIAANTHMPTVRTNSRAARLRRHDDQQRWVVARGPDHHQAEHDAQDVADDGAEHGLHQDDLDDVAGRGAERAQGGELVEVVLGAGVERLGDDDDADDQAERRAGDEGRAGARLEQPAVEAALAELVVGEDLRIRRLPGELGASRVVSALRTSSMSCPARP